MVVHRLRCPFRIIMIPEILSLFFRSPLADFHSQNPTCTAVHWAQRRFVAPSHSRIESSPSEKTDSRPQRSSNIAGLFQSLGWFLGSFIVRVSTAREQRHSTDSFKSRESMNSSQSRIGVTLALSWRVCKPQNTQSSILNKAKVTS